MARETFRRLQISGPLALAVALMVGAASVAANAQSPVTLPQRPGQPKLDVDFEATPPVVVKAMLDIARVSGADIVLDLGCGEGRIPIAAAKHYGARAICLDLDPQRIREARANAEKAGVADRVTFIEGDLFKADLTQATVITMFLWDTINLKLRPKLLDLAPGTRIVSHAHDMGDWMPDAQQLHNRKSADGPSMVYLWVIPARIDGAWRLEIGGDTYEMAITQKYQNFVGTDASKGGRARIRNGRIAGDAVSFEVITAKGRVMRAAGHVRENTIVTDEPAAVPPGKAAPPPLPFQMRR